MVNILAKFKTLICLCFIGVYCDSDPWVWPMTFVHDGKQQRMEFTCGSYLGPGDYLSWYRVDVGNPPKMTTYIQQSTHGYSYRTIKFIWPLALMPKVKKVYCVKETWNHLEKKQTEVSSISYQADLIKPMDVKASWGPWLTPDTFVDDGKHYIELTCWAYLREGEVLSWYQVSRGSTSATLLAWIRQETNYGYEKIMLRKKLEPSDNGAQIYCKSADSRQSKHIDLTIEKPMETLQSPYVKPDTGIVFFDEDDELEFICGGGSPVDGSKLTWYLQGATLLQNYQKSTNLNHLTVPVDSSYHRIQLYCTQELKQEKSEGNVVVNNRELARSRSITLLHRAKCNPKETPQVMPEGFVNDGKPYIQFTCYAFLQMGEVLSWYKSKDSRDTLLRMIQLWNPGTNGQWMELDLKKTLEPSDEGSEIFCAKQTVLLGQWGLDLSGYDRAHTSRSIKIDSGRDIPQVSAVVNIYPNKTDIYFDVNTKLQFTCSGSEPVDGRRYTWYMKNNDHLPSILVPENQKYDVSTNVNNLEIFVDETYHLNKLFCVQEFNTQIRYTDGPSQYSKPYGHLARSMELTLIKRETTTSTATTSTTTTTSAPETTKLTPSTLLTIDDKNGVNYGLSLAILIPLLVVTLIAAAVATWALCGRRRGDMAPQAPKSPQQPPAPLTPSEDSINDGIYINLTRIEPPEVTYAVLDLPKKPSTAPRPYPPEACLYTEVVGVCNK